MINFNYENHINESTNKMRTKWKTPGWNYAEIKACIEDTLYNLYHVDSYIVSEFDIKSMYGPMVDPDLVISAVDSLYREMEII